MHKAWSMIEFNYSFVKMSRKSWLDLINCSP